MVVELDQILAVFLVDNDDTAERFLKKLQAIEKADTRVEIVDAAIAHRTKLGRVKVHQTTDRGAMKGGLRGGAFGVVVGTILLGPAGAVVGGAAGGMLAGLHNRFHDIGINDKFMREVTHEVEKGKSALFVLYQGEWANSIGAVEDAVKAEHALLIQSTMSPEKAAELKELVEPAAEELGGEEVLDDYEVETEPEPEAEVAAVAAAASEPAAPAPAAAAPAVAEVVKPDDLTQLDGIGPKTAIALSAAGITTYRALAEANEPQIRRALHEADMTAPANVGTWPMQAEFAANGDWRGLMSYHDKHTATRTVTTKAPAAAAAAPVAESAVTKPDDLTKLSGIGPRIEVILAEGGVNTYDKLAHTTADELRAILAASGALPPSSLRTWPAQAAFAAKGDWEGLAKYNHH